MKFPWQFIGPLVRRDATGTIDWVAASCTGNIDGANRGSVYVLYLRHADHIDYARSPLGDAGNPDILSTLQLIMEAVDQGNDVPGLKVAIL
jgi:hypothetical protein